MLDIFPVEVWLNIFKQTDVEDLFKKREVCRGFKEIIDVNLKHFYLNFSRQQPNIYPLKSTISRNDFIRGITMLFIDNFSNYDCYPYYIKKMQDDNITLKQARFILYLKESHNFDFWLGGQCINMNKTQLNQVFKLIDIKVPPALAIRHSKQNIYTEKQFNIFSDLFSKGVSDYYSDKIAVTFSEEQLERFYFLLDNTDHWWVHIAWMIERENL